MGIIRIPTMQRCETRQRWMLHGEHTGRLSTQASTQYRQPSHRLFVLLLTPASTRLDNHRWSALPVLVLLLGLDCCSWNANAMG